MTKSYINWLKGLKFKFSERKKINCWKRNKKKLSEKKQKMSEMKYQLSEMKVSGSSFLITSITGILFKKWEVKGKNLFEILTDSDVMILSLEILSKFNQSK